MAVLSRRAVASVARDLAHSRTFDEWSAAARAFDALTGNDAPPDDAVTALLHEETDALRRLRTSDPHGVVERLRDSLYRTMGDLATPGLYDGRLAGTRPDVDAYLEEAERTLSFLCDAPIPGVEPGDRIAAFRDAATTLGRTALLLSGGATLGFHHLGVVKALFDQDLLPDVISGASTGAMIGAGIAARTPAEIRDLFDDVTQIRRDGLTLAAPLAAARSRAILDPARLYEVLRHNVGDYTFDEAFRRSGRVLGIAVSPTRTRQRPRLLCHKTSPDVLVASAALASSALPGLFPPIVLDRRNRRGEVVPYLPEERWVDGSIRHDLPMMRLARLHNVNHFVVSQTNPHVLPFVSARGGLGFALGLVGHSAKVQGAGAIEVARRVSGGSPLRNALDHLYALVAQEYRGDVDIHPRLRPRAWLRVVANPTLDELRAFILEGQRATWPRLAQIRDQTRIRRALARCVARLERPPDLPARG